jgi:hypothetical protein
MRWKQKPTNPVQKKLKARTAEPRPYTTILKGGIRVPSVGTHASLLGDTRCLIPVAIRPKARLVRDLQRRYGNSFVQKVVGRIQAEADVQNQICAQVEEEEEKEGTEMAQRQVEEEEEELQTKEGLDHPPKDGSNLESRINKQRGGGQSLHKSTRDFFESRFGYDFSQVRVHTDTESDNLNRDLNARAFTTGEDIFFRRGEYNPGSSNGRELLAHELTHVVQQTGETRSKLTIGQPGDKYEQEADQLAKAIIEQGKTIVHPKYNYPKRHRKSDESTLQTQTEEEEDALKFNMKEKDDEFRVKTVESKVQSKMGDNYKNQFQTHSAEKSLQNSIDIFKTCNKMDIQRQKVKPVGQEPNIPMQPNSVVLKTDAIYLIPLREYPIHIVDPVMLNQGHKKLLRRIEAANNQSAESRDVLGFLEFSEEAGKKDLGAVHDVSSSLGKRAKGVKGEYLRNSIETYVKSNRYLTTKIMRVHESQALVASRIAKVHKVVLAGKELEAETREEAAQQEVSAIQKRIQKATGIANKVIDITAKLLQGKWKDAGIDLAKFVGKEIISAGIEAAYSEELEEAQNKLKEIKENLARIREEKQAKAVEIAVKELEAANTDAEADQNELIGAAEAAELAMVTLNEVFRQMGYEKASKAIDARALVMETSDYALRVLIDYDKRVSIITSSSQRLKVLNNNLAALMSKGSELIPIDDHRFEMYDSASFNGKMLEKIEDWGRNELGLIELARNYIESGEYLKQYDAIDRVLRQGLVTR